MGHLVEPCGKDDGRGEELVFGVDFYIRQSVCGRVRTLRGRKDMYRRRQKRDGRLQHVYLSEIVRRSRAGGKRWKLLWQKKEGRTADGNGEVCDCFEAWVKLVGRQCSC
jgi:hypothetical protein